MDAPLRNVSIGIRRLLKRPTLVVIVVITLTLGLEATGAGAPSFVVTNANDQGPGSFREAIINANATPGTDTIIFNIPGPGVKVISLLTPLPEVTDPVVIAADAQPGYAGAPPVDLSNLTNATRDSNHGAGTIIDDDKLELLLEELGPTVNQVAALDAFLFLRDTFPVVGIPEWFPTASDRNTRVMFFVRNLQLNPGESSSAVTVRLETINQFFEVPAEDVRSIPNVEFTQVTIRLPDDLPANVYTVTIMAHSRFSNTGTIRIAPL